MQNDLVGKLETEALHYDNPDWTKRLHEQAAAEIRRLSGLVEEAREALDDVLAEALDRGLPERCNTVTAARATLSRLEPQIEGEGR